MQITVYYVIFIVLIHLLVTAKLVIGKMKMVFVRIVLIIVLPVFIQLIVLNVKILIVEFLNFVNVSMGTLMPVFQTVMPVPHNV